MVPKRRSGGPYDAVAGLPRKNVPVVAHFGSMNPDQKVGDSLEGPALSVTTPTHADDWRRIARLGGRDYHEMPGGTFLHASVMSGPQWKQVTDWGQRQGLVGVQRKWRAYSTDEEDDEVYSEHDSLEEAHEESAEGRVRPHKTVVPLSSEAERMSGREYALLKLAQRTGKRGVWWSDEPGTWSAPRGAAV